MEIGEFLDRRLSKRFRTYDDDGDGFIEREDFAVASRRLGEEFGHGPDSEAWQRFDELCVGLWEHLVQVADTDGVTACLICLDVVEEEGRVRCANQIAAIEAPLIEQHGAGRLHR